MSQRTLSVIFVFISIFIELMIYKKEMLNTLILKNYIQNQRYLRQLKIKIFI
jgi:hypothetical protein